MPGQRGWIVEGLIVAVLKPGVYRARLSNGHELVAFVAGRAGRAAAAHRVGESVRIAVSAYDLSRGRVLDGRHNGGAVSKQMDL